MRFPMFCCSWICFLLVLLSTSVSAIPYEIPRLSPIGHKLLQKVESVSSAISSDFVTYYYNQTLDHFNFRPDSYTIFSQRYVINKKYWRGPNAKNAAILAYFGAEAPIDGDLETIGFLTENAMQFNALVVYIEHRYYGKSMPFGPSGQAAKDASTLGYFNSAQAIADYADILIHIKKEYNANYTPTIVIGGSYGGMLASWFRLKYPHVAHGALASSAPVLYFDDITEDTAYYSVVSKDFRSVSETCYQTIRASWSELRKVSSQRNGLSTLSQKFKTCKPLKSYEELENKLVAMYGGAAQYDSPPKYPVTQVCNGIDGAPAGSGMADKIAQGLFSFAKGLNLTCYFDTPTTTQTGLNAGWSWQACTEMVLPMLGKGMDSMFPPKKFDLKSFSASCKQYYGVPPRPHWVTTYYGGRDIKLDLKRFGSNIIYSNGLRDPYSAGSVLEDISSTIVAVTTPNGSHCLDIQKSANTDPVWLVKQRQTMVNIMKGWITQYHADLQNYKHLGSHTKEDQNHIIYGYISTHTTI